MERPSTPAPRGCSRGRWCSRRSPTRSLYATWSRKSHRRRSGLLNPRVSCPVEGQRLTYRAEPGLLALCRQTHGEPPEELPMEFGILFTSHPNTVTEPYPHRDVHARVTREILRADELGYDYAWVAEHHFSNEYGIMPDVFIYAAYLAALTKRIKIGTAVVTLPLANPVRVAENAAFIDILSKGRFVLGLGSGYRQYEFDAFGADFEARREIQEEALPLLMELFHDKRVDHRGKHYQVTVDGEYELFPHPLQQTHPPIFLAGATDRSIGVAGQMGFGLMLSTWTPFEGLAKQVKRYRDALDQTPTEVPGNPARGHVDIARWVYVAESDAKAKAESEAGLLRHQSHFFN